jgi:hypothetical protein
MKASQSPFSSDPDEQDPKKKLKKVKNALDAITSMKRNQDNSMSFSETADSPVINLNTKNGKVFELPSADATVENDHNQHDLGQNAPTTKVTSST